MRLHEIVNPPFYLCSDHKRTIGDVLEQSHQYPLGADREGKIEYRRPDDALPRDTSFYLDAAPREAPYVYLVAPVGQVDRHSTSWLKLLAKTLVANASEMDSYATGYWSGKPWPEDQEAPTELRAAKVKVLKRVGGYETFD